MQRIAALILSGLIIAVFTLPAQRGSAKPWDLSTYTCEMHQKVMKDAPQLGRVLSFWAHGYVSGAQKSDVKATPVSGHEIRALSESIEEACGSDGKRLFIDALGEIK